ncbi:hypothetical protein ABET41_20175 [Metabacillus fastidiosus]|uniref:Uncharacterized protein n=1 Tax=Metabacillus fastidiosus TaxID=1458 RepID=A0ABU6NZY1_9BACI|nr:hypothetical protein [Metabacillus fastidiosus]MED4401942.1 hypothetical protein [Metabacillus fastidiosus]MED4460925.1 hypothetical protein [Metabacillus fastidiosus]
MGDWNEQAAPNNNLNASVIRSSNLITNKEEKMNDKKKISNKQKKDDSV